MPQPSAADHSTTGAPAQNNEHHGASSSTSQQPLGKQAFLMLSSGPKGQRAARAPLRITTAVTNARNLPKQPRADSLLLVKINFAKLSDVQCSPRATSLDTATRNLLHGVAQWRTCTKRKKFPRRSPKLQLATIILFPRRSPEQCTACLQHVSNRRRAQDDRRHRTQVTVRRLPS